MGVLASLQAGRLSFIKRGENRFRRNALGIDKDRILRGLFADSDQISGLNDSALCKISDQSTSLVSNGASFLRMISSVSARLGMRVLETVANAVPVRLMKRDLLFVAERLALTLDERRLGILFKLHKLGKANGQADSAPKLFSTFLHKADERSLGRLLVELAILQPAGSPGDTSKALREAAEFYKVDVAAITAKVKQEFAAKDQAKAKKPPKQPKVVKKRAAA